MKVPICTECVVNMHPQHSYERLSDAEAKNVTELEMLVLKAKEKIVECHGDLSQTLDQYLFDLQEQLEQSRTLIEQTHQSYKAVLEKRKVQNKINHFKNFCQNIYFFSI